MLLKDIIKRVIEIVGLEDEVSISTPSAKLNKLIASANMIYQELTLQYVHLKTKESIDFVDGRAYFASFTYGVREVLAVTQNGIKVDFETYPMYIKATIEGAAEVTYLYHLPELALADDVVLPPQFTQYFLATGVASEYYYRVGLIDEALFYKNRYEAALANLTHRIKTSRLPVRRFL